MALHNNIQNLIIAFETATQPVAGEDYRCYGDAIIQLTAHDDYIRLETIRANMPFNGAGTKAIELLKTLADEFGVSLYAECSLIDITGHATLKELKDWYARRGFVEEAGDMAYHPSETAILPLALAA